MSTLRRLILCTALLIAFILLGAQALGMLAAHRYLNTQLAQQGQAGASALAWVLSHDPGGVQDKRQLADDLFGAGMYALVRIAGENGDTQAERREPAQNRQAGAPRDWRDAWLSMDAPAATRPYLGPDGRRMGTVTVQADARLARDTLWQGGVRVIGLTLAAGVFWTLFAANLMRWLEARTSRDGLGRDRALHRLLLDDEEIIIEALVAVGHEGLGLCEGHLATGQAGDAQCRAGLQQVATADLDICAHLVPPSRKLVILDLSLCRRAVKRDSRHSKRERSHLR